MARALHLRKLLLGLLLSIGLVALTSVPGNPLGGGTVAFAHALLVRSDPAADAVLRAPPSQVRMWFSEDLNPATSRAIVVDTANREVDRQGSHVNSSNAREMDVSLPLLKAGTYVVVWRTQSADDGHIVGGSFIFRIARPDGSVPPLPAILPTGHIPGAGGTVSTGSSSLDGPTWLQTLGTWLSELFLAFWLGGLIWETWILPPQTQRHAALRAAAQSSTRRFARLAPYALGVILIADAFIVLGQSAELAGDWLGAFDPALLHAVLFGSRFGSFWWLREGLAAAALVLGVVASRYGWPSFREASPAAAPELSETWVEQDETPDWRREVLAVIGRVPRIPARLVAGWRGRAWCGRVKLVLGVALLVAFAFSGHASAVAANEFGYAVSVDVLHLLCTALWVGGLLYIGAVLVPALHELEPRARAQVLALGLPEFSALAIVSVGVLAATGTLSTTIHLTSAEQFITTSYGRTLFVKIELFLLMVAISAYHAFFLRPRLALALRQREAEVGEEQVMSSPVASVASVATVEPLTTAARATHVGHGTQGDEQAPRGATATGDAHERRVPGARAPLSSEARSLSERIEDWLRREAALGIAVLACVALLAAFAGSLAPAAGASAPSGGTATQASAPFAGTKAVGNYSVTLHVAPASFGTNTFTVDVKDTHGAPVTGGAVLVQTTMLDMDMGTQSVQLKPVAGSPGQYAGQGDLTMAGHWQITVKVLPPGSSQFQITSFKLDAAN